MVASAAADPLAPPEAVLTPRLPDGRVWLVHAVLFATIVASVDLAHLAR